MHKPYFINKKIAFTLAEMMVILTVMSVVMAATMPIITAPDNASLSGGSQSDDLWAYGNASKTVSTPNFVAIGMAPTVNTKGIDTASLFINNRADYANATHILFTASQDNKVYNAGRLYMGPADKYNVALGARTMSDVTNDDIYNVAIGTLAMDKGFASGARKYSVALGAKALYSNIPVKSVAIGKGALSANGSASVENSVAVGYFAGAMNSGRMRNGTHIGYMAGYTTDVNHDEHNNVNIGNIAGAFSYGNNKVNIGASAGYYSNILYKGNPSSDYVNIGNMAGAMSNASAPVVTSSSQDVYSSGHVAIGTSALFSAMAGVSDTIAIGAEAGYKIMGDSKRSVLIGYQAGYNLQQGNPQDMIVAIGPYASYMNAGNAIAIGYRAGAYVGDTSATYAGAGRSSKHNNDKMINEVVIGDRAGTVAKLTGGSYGNIMIGTQSGSELNATANKYLINSICLGAKSCPKGTTGVYSLFIGQYAGAAPTTSAAGKHASFSIVTTEWPQPVNGDVNTGISKSLFKNVVHYNDSRAEQYGQLILAPSPKYYSSSRITLDATTVYAPSSSPLTYSDIRMKKNIKPLAYSLSTLKGINVYEYSYLNEQRTRRIGVIAQELLKVIPEAVDTSDKDHYTVNPEWVFYPIINAIKELDKSVETFRIALVNYAKEYQTLSSKVKTLEKEQNQLEKERRSLERQINRAYKKAERMEKSA